MHPLIEQLLLEGPVITDGAWGTELQARGLEVGGFPDEWNLSQPDRVVEVAKAYVAAGSRIILTNTFGANRIRLQQDGLQDKVTALNQRGVELSRSAAAGRAYVFASIGPSGQVLLDEGVKQDELATAFAEQAKALAQAGADALVIETMCDLAEAQLAITAAQTTGLPIVACVVFDSGKDKDRTLMGKTPEQVAAVLQAAGVDIIGANCGQGIGGYASICRRLRAATDRPIWLKPNAGQPELVEGRARYQTAPEEFARAVPELISAGANFIGGCCGTTPAFIRALRTALAEIGQPLAKST